MGLLMQLHVIDRHPTWGPVARNLSALVALGLFMTAILAWSVALAPQGGN